MSSLCYRKARAWDGGVFSCPEPTPNYEDKWYAGGEIRRTPNSAPGTLFMLSVTALYKGKPVE